MPPPKRYFFESAVSLQVKIDRSQAIPKKTCKKAWRARLEAGGSLRKGRRSCDFRIEFAPGITRCHLGGGQHFLEFAGLTRGVEFLQPLLAELGHRFHRGFKIFARIEFTRILAEHLAD